MKIPQAVVDASRRTQDARAFVSVWRSAFLYHIDLTSVPLTTTTSPTAPLELAAWTSTSWTSWSIKFWCFPTIEMEKDVKRAGQRPPCLNE